MPMTTESTVLWIIAVILLFFAFLFFYRKSKRSDVSASKNLFLGIGLFFGLYSITRILFIAGWYITYDELSGLYQNFWTAATIVGMVGFILLMFVLEKYPLNLKTKFLGTIFGCIVLAISIIFGSGIGSIALAYSLPFMGILIIATYLYLTIISPAGAIRSRALQNFLGILMVLFGVIFDTNISYNIFAALSPELAYTLQQIVAPVLFMLGVIVFMNPYREKD
jgi:hypothetical protein